MILILIISVLLVLVGLLLSDFFIEIPAYHFGVVERFGKRIDTILYEGLRTKLPFIDSVELISTELVEIDVPANFTTQDKLQLTCNGSLQYRPDPLVKRKGKCVFVEMSEEIIKSGIEDTIKAKMGALGGIKFGEDFITLRHAISDMLNCFFRLEEPPHKKHDGKTCEICNAHDEKTCKICSAGKKKCGLPVSNGANIDASALLDFYSTHWVAVKDALKSATSASEVEERYGIDIEYYALASIDFSKATMEAFEKQKQADAKAGAFDRKIEMAKKAQALGASAQVALNAADISLDPSVNKKVVSVEGEAGILGGILEAIGKGGSK